MAKNDVPMVRKDLTAAQVEERREILSKRVHEATELRAKKRAADDAHRTKTKSLKDSISLLDEQIETLGNEIHEGAAMVPIQLDLGDDASAPPPIPGVPSTPSAKKRGARKKTTGRKTSTRRSRTNGVAATP